MPGATLPEFHDELVDVWVMLSRFTHFTVVPRAIVIDRGWNARPSTIFTFATVPAATASRRVAAWAETAGTNVSAASVTAAIVKRFISDPPDVGSVLGCPAEPTSEMVSDEFRLDRDRRDRRERLRDRARVLRLLGDLLEPRVLDPVDLGLGAQLDGRDVPAGLRALEAHLGGGADPAGLEPGASERPRERHRVAPGVRRGD